MKTTKDIICPACKGRGERMRPSDVVLGILTLGMAYDPEMCVVCSGTGKITMEETSDDDATTH